MRLRLTGVAVNMKQQTLRAAFDINDDDEDGSLVVTFRQSWRGTLELSRLDALPSKFPPLPPVSFSSSSDSWFEEAEKLEREHHEKLRKTEGTHYYADICKYSLSTEDAKACDEPDVAGYFRKLDSNAGWVFCAAVFPALPTGNYVIDVVLGNERYHKRLTVYSRYITYIVTGF